MKKIAYIFAAIGVLLGVQSCKDNKYDIKKPDNGGEQGSITPTAFNKGVNLEDWFQVDETSGSIGSVNEKNYRKADFENFKELGIDVVRVPMTMGAFTGGAPDYKFDDRFWTKLDYAIDLAEEAGVSIIIDNHSWNLGTKFPDNAVPFMKSIWAQIAEHCKKRSGKVYYELKNEPDGTWNRSNWPDLQGELIKIVRDIDTQHGIIITHAPYHNLWELPEYDYENLIYTFHFYDPFIFTHQGASWCGLGTTGGAVPFPYDADKFTTPEGVRDDHKQAFTDYPTQGTEAYIYSIIDKNIEFAKKRNAQLFVGEFGALGHTGMEPKERNNWHKIVRQYFEQNDISWTLWSYNGGFGIFKRYDQKEEFDKDLDLDLIKALGFTVPASYQGGGEPVGPKQNMVIYDDFWGPRMQSIVPSPSDWGHLAIPYTTNPAQGQNCIEWTVNGSWSYLTFAFRSQAEDLSIFDIDNTALEFKFKCAGDGNRFGFEIFIVNNKDKMPAGKQHEWTIKHGIWGEVVDYDGQWHIVSLPLKNFEYREALDANKDSEGNFSWEKIKEIQFTSFMNNEFGGEKIYIDDVKLVGPTGSETPIDPTADGTVSLTPSPATVELDSDNPTAQALKLDWAWSSDSRYKDEEKAIGYTVEFAKSGTGFAKIATADAKAAKTKSFLAQELNDLLVNNGLAEEGETVSLDVRVSANVAGKTILSSTAAVSVRVFDAVVPPLQPLVIYNNGVFGDLFKDMASWDNIDYPVTEAPVAGGIGQNCLKWNVAGAWQYFCPSPKATTVNVLPYEDGTFEFWMKAPAENFDIHIYMACKLPGIDNARWAKRFYLNNWPSFVTIDGSWHNIAIPMSEFEDIGRFEGDSGEGQFSWEHLNEIQFTTKDGDKMNCQIYFDNMKFVPKAD